MSMLPDSHTVRLAALLVVCAIMLVGWANSSATSTGQAVGVVSICPTPTIQVRGAAFSPGGLILTTFDRANLWVYNIDANSRYPLPETFPCGGNCHLSPDFRWITYPNAFTNAYSKMRLDGTERTSLIPYASEVQWWSTETLLVWTPGHEAYLQPEAGGERDVLDVRGVVMVQPGGRWGLHVAQQGDFFVRSLLNLETREQNDLPQERVWLGLDTTYFNAAAWSPDGTWLAYVAPGMFDLNAQISGGELFGIRPGDALPTQWTTLTGIYGAVRINGRAVGELSWSPDSTRLAFWVMPLSGADPEQNTGQAVIHLLDVDTGTLTAYCGYSTDQHTPNPPRLVWSPDGTHLAFGGRVAGDTRGYLLLALNTLDGVFTELSVGVYPALGNPDVVAWGLPPQ
ncbi:MAG: hypothetical protein SF029_23350 [bacterium]|nr:hypothetical protein [bacterium]